MNDIIEEVAAEHVRTYPGGCSCGGDLPLGSSFSGHVAEVTERLVRERIAAQIREASDLLDADVTFMTTATPQEAMVEGMRSAADLAVGEGTVTVTWRTTVEETYTADVPRGEFFRAKRDGSLSNWLAEFEERPPAASAVLERDVFREG